MVEPIVSTVLSLVENFTLKKFIAVCVVLLAIISTVFIYEQYTDNFKLTRLQKSAEVLRILQEIKESDIENNQSLLPIYNDIQNELATLSDPANPASLSFEPSYSGFKKFGAAFFPWGLMALVSYIQQKRKTAKEPSLVLGFITVGIIFGCIGYMLPTILKGQKRGRTKLTS